MTPDFTKISVLASLHALAALTGTWLITKLFSSGAYAISAADARVLLITAPIAGALGSLLLSRFAHRRRVRGPKFTPWLRVVLVSLGVTLIVGIAISTAFSLGGLQNYHTYMANQNPDYSFDYRHAASTLLFFNSAGAVAALFAVLPLMLLASLGWLFFARKK